jgi:hypothetical protein
MSEDPGAGEEPRSEKYPFTFIILIVAAALDLLLRLVQSIGWLADKVGG